MKYITYILILFIIYACSESGTSNLEKSNPVNPTIEPLLNKRLDTILQGNYDKVNAKTDTNDQKKELLLENYKNLPKVSLPFGSKILIEHNFPTWWKNDSYNRIDSILPNEKEFETLGKYYYKINNNPSGNCPDIKKSEFVFYGDHKFCLCNDSISKLYCKYKLPDFGSYNCFYVYNGEDIENFCGNSCMSYGNLLFLDTISKSAKVLNVYSEMRGDQHISFRYFYIDKNKSIKIFEGSCYDDGCSLINRYQIDILKNGEVKITTKD